MNAVIFDFNGTMIFDGALQEKAWRTYISQHTGKPVSDQDFLDFIHGRNVDITLSHFWGRTFSRAETAAMEEEKEVIYRELCLHSPDFRLADGLPAFLEELKRAHIPMTIATASNRQNVLFFFQQLGLSAWFDPELVAYNDGSIAGKPEPDLFLKAASLLQADIRQCVIFEDSPSGLEAARRSGASRVIRVASMEYKLSSAAVDGVIRDYTDRASLYRMTGLPQPSQPAPAP